MEDFLFENSNLFVFLSLITLVVLVVSIISVFMGIKKFTRNILIEDTYFKNVKLEHSINYVEKELCNDFMCPIVNGRCKEEECYAFVQIDKGTFCNFLHLKFTRKEWR